MPKGKPNTLDEMPVEAIRNAMSTTERVSLRITRRNDKGHIASVYSGISMTLDEVLEIEPWLKTRAGGGRYRIECRDPQDKTRYVIQPFYVGVEGLPRPPAYLGPVTGGAPPGATQPAAPGGPMHNPYDPNVPPHQQVGGYAQVHNTPFYGYQQGAQVPQGWAQGLHPSQRSHYAMPTHHRMPPAPGATIASDQVALRQLEEQKAEHKAQIAKLEEQNKALLERIDRLMDDMKQEREKAREERHKAEMRALEARLEALNKPVEKSNSTGEMIAALAPFAPVLSAMVTSRESSSSKSLELQQQGLTQLMQATLTQANKPDSSQEMLKTFLPLVLPLVKEMMDNKSPAAQAQLFNSMVENNLNSVAMMAQLVEAFANAGGDEPWWLPAIRETMTGVVGMAEAYMQGNGGLPGQMRPLPEGSPQALPPGMPQQPGASGYSTVNLDEVMTSAPAMVEQPTVVTPAAVTPAPAAPVSEGDGPRTAAELEAMLLEDATAFQRLMLKKLPDDFQTPEWRIVVLAMHQNDDVDEVAALIAGHIAHLINFRMLPEALLDIETDPARALDRVLGPLPIAKSEPEFAQDVLRKVITMLHEDGFIAPPKPIIDTTAEEVSAQAQPATA